jgi:putative transposase
MSSIKSYSAKETIELLAKDKNNKLLSLLEENKLKYKTESKHQFWQEGFHPQLISSEEIFIQKTDYIHLNPVRRGLVEKPEDWKYSSAAYYLKGKESLIKIDEF